MKVNKIFLLPLSLGICVPLFSGFILNSKSSYKDNDHVKLNNVAKGGEGVFYSSTYSSSFEDEPYYSTQKDITFDSMNLGAVPNYYRGDSVKVAVIDSGINYSHEDFKLNDQSIVNLNSCSIEWTGSQWLRYLYSNNTSHLNDSSGHGSNAASVIASQINELGCAGIAPNVDLYVYKVTNSQNGYEWGAIQTALTQCIYDGVDVINMSFQAYEHDVSYNTSSMPASSGCSSILTTWLNNCYNAGITLVAAAGNFNTEEPSYPASNSHVISVGSLARGSTVTKAGFSNLSNIDLVAPGYVQVATTGSNSSYKETQGTSFSAPIVTAAIALYKQKYPSATNSEIEAALYASCDALDGNPSWAGHGRLNLLRFLNEEHTPTVESVTVTPSVLNLDLNGGTTGNLSATVTGTYSPAQTVTWTSSNTNVATVSSSGVVTAKGVGNATITATSTVDGTKSGTCSVTVSDSAVHVTGVSLNKTSTNLYIDGTETLVATVLPNNATNKNVTWTSNNTSVATVSSSGVVTAKAVGNATITVTTSDGGFTATCNVTVANAPAAAGTYTILPSHFTGSYPTSDTSIGFTSFDIKANNVMDINVSGTHYIQFKSTPGYIYNSSPQNIKRITFNNINAGSFRVYGGNTANPSSLISGTDNTYTFTNGQKFFKIASNSSTTKVGSITIELTNGKILSSIAIKTPPEKTVYYENEAFNPKGLEITATYSDATTEDFSYDTNPTLIGFSPSLYEALDTSVEFVTIRFGGLTCTQPITVKEIPVLSSISISGYKTSFIEGDAFEFGGTVIAHYTNAPDADVTNWVSFTGHDMTKLGVQTVTVHFTELGVHVTQEYQITVSVGTLSSISVSGQTTSYQKNSTFSFDGVVTATFENGYQKVVEPLSVSEPNMTQVGHKTVTVTYEYNGVTKTTEYEINVARTVTEESEIELNSTITWPTSSTPSIEGELSNVSAVASGKTVYENTSIRLGTGNGGGTLTISATEAIAKVEVVAKYYSSYSSSTLKVDGQNVNFLSSSYDTYTVTLASPKTSFTILTENSSSRINIQSITLYHVSTSMEDISSSEDCLGLETFIDTYLHMDYVDSLGYCKDDVHHYYIDAKSAFNSLNAHQRSLFVSNSAYTNEFARLSAWAKANGELFKNDNTLSSNGYNGLLKASNDNKAIVVIVVLASIMSSLVFTCIVIHKKKEHK